MEVTRSGRVDLAIVGGTVVPMVRDGEWEIADVAIAGGRIAAVGPGAGSDAADTIDATGCLVVPGFVQAHVHVVQSLLRHQADGLDLLDWLRRRTWPYEAALDGEATGAAAALGIAELLAGGTTTALDFGSVHHYDRVFTAAERLGIRLVGGKTHMDAGAGVPPGLMEGTERSLADAEELGLRWHGAADGRLRYAVCPRFALSCTPELYRGAVELARRHGWLLHTHASESAAETAAVEAATGATNVAWLDGIGFTGRDTVLAHGVHLTDGEIATLGRTGTAVCHCPGANLKLASGIADVPRLLAAGVRVALGADGPPCNNRLSIFHEMALAGTIHGLRHGPTAMDAWTVLAMATRDGARALGLGDEIGTLEAGKAADVAVIGTDGWALQPAGDPASRLVFGATAADVRHTIVAGHPVVRDRRLATVGPEELRRRAAEAWAAVSARMGAGAATPAGAS